MQNEHRGFLFALLAVLFTSTMSLFVKLSSSATISTLIFSRFILGVPIFLWIVHHKKIRLRWKEVPKNLTRSLAGVLNLYAFYFALKSLPLVNAITLANTAPLFIPLLLLIFSKLVFSKRRYFAIGIGFLGVVIILRPAASDFFVLASFLGLASGLLRAVATLNVRLLAKTENSEKILSYYFFIGASLSFFPFIFDWQSFSDPIQWIYVFLAGILALGYQYTFTKACASVPATKVGTVSYLAVVLGGLFGWWVFGEIPDLWVLAGVVLIILGAFLSLIDPTSPRSFKRE